MGSTVVHIVDHDEGTRATTARMLTLAGFVVRTYALGEELLADFQPNTPGCIVLNVYMPGRSGFEVQAALAERQASLPIVFVTRYPHISDSVRAIRDGAVDFLTKPVEPHALLDAVSRAVAKDAADRAEQTRRHALVARYERLTDREREVLKHLISGQTNKDVAADLHITARTVKLHRARIVRKLEIFSLAQLVWFASEIGIQPPPIDVVRKHG
jgi:FixJ family two-component response regulator